MALKRCTTCNGSGTKTYQTRGIPPTETVPCPGECKGQGWIVVPDEKR